MIANWAIAVIAFLGAFVIDEPAPYELLLCPIIVVWSLFGLRLNRHFAPMAVLLLLYITGGLLALTQLRDPLAGLMYMATSLFLGLSAIFFAAVVWVEPARRLSIIKNAYIGGAVVASAIGILAYFRILPNSEMFLLYDRIKGTFQDPNVFGPFIVLPIIFLAQDILQGRPRLMLKAGLLLILILAEFLAFSRAAWGMTVLGLILVAAFAFLTEGKQLARFRIATAFMIGAALVVVLIVVALSIPAVSNLFEQRAQLVEYYDSGEFGRFARYDLGFQLLQQRPLGIGPGSFAKLFGEDEHNMWLKGFSDYGWLGGFSYIVLAAWTLIAAGRLIFRPRPWQPYLHAVYAVFIGQIMIHNVIDNDHWRHLFLIYGLLWGMVAAEKVYRRSMRQAGAPIVAPNPPALAAMPVR